MVNDTFHYKSYRRLREEFIQNVLGGYGNLIHQGYTKNKFNQFLSEVHKVYDNGIIVVVNPHRGMDRIVTTKIARPKQLRDAIKFPLFIGIEDKKIIKEKSCSVLSELTLRPSYFYNARGWNEDVNLPERDEWEYWKYIVSSIKRDY